MNPIKVVFLGILTLVIYKTAQGFFVPAEVWQRDRTVGTDNAGGYLRPNVHRADLFIDVLRVIFPPMWMFPHEGEMPKKEPKFIMSTYSHFMGVDKSRQV